MLVIDAPDLSPAELDELRKDHDIVDRPGCVTVLNARKVDERIVWSTTRMKEGYWRTLQAERKNAEPMPAAA